MSRTIRRKNKETPDTYRKYGLRYDEDFNVTYIGEWKLEGEELKTSLRKFHQEGNTSRYGYSPPKDHRKETVASQRMHDKSELFKFSNDSSYEPMVFERKPLEYWT